MIIKTITTLKGEAMLDFRMETFLKVCEYMNFTHAAHDLNLTQPAVSQHIKYLEKEYKMPGFYGILILTGRGVLSRFCPD